MEATANYYAVQVLEFKPEDRVNYWSKEIASYLSVPIDTNADDSKYPLAHFLDWLEHAKWNNKSIVAKVLQSRIEGGTYGDLENLNSVIQKQDTQKKGLDQALLEYCKYFQVPYKNLCME
jgi:hypothetical protein